MTGRHADICHDTNAVIGAFVENNDNIKAEYK